MKKILFTAALALMAFGAAAQNIACVNSQELIYLCPEADAVRTKMEEATKLNQDAYLEMAQEYEQKVNQYNNNKASWSTSILKSKEQELAQLEQRIQATAQQMQAELQQMEQDLYAPIMEKVRDTIQKLANEGGYVYVFDKASIIYVDEAKAADITAKARKALNIPADRTIEALQKELAAKQQAAQK